MLHIPRRSIHRVAKMRRYGLESGERDSPVTNLRFSSRIFAPASSYRKGRNAYRSPSVTGVASCSSEHENTTAPPRGRFIRLLAVFREPEFSFIFASVQIDGHGESAMCSAFRRIVAVRFEEATLGAAITGDDM